jgi:hypothetical protein
MARVGFPTHGVLFELIPAGRIVLQYRESQVPDTGSMFGERVCRERGTA